MSTQARAAKIRALTLEQVLVQGGGYLGQACSSAEILATLFSEILNIGPSISPFTPGKFTGVPGTANPSPSGVGYLGEKRSDYDRFFLSPSHYAMALYATLIAHGRLDQASLAEFNVDGSTLEMIGAEHSPGLELTSGSFGQAFSQAAGIAWSRKFRGETGKVWVFLSDGEMQEGQTWEAVQFAAYHKLDNLRIVVDVNGQQVDDRMENVMNVEPLEDRFRSFGANVIRTDGHDVAALLEASQLPSPDAPLVILADTHPTTGIPVLENRGARLHYIRVLNETDRGELQAALDHLNIEAGAL
ncbi:MAG: thiamine pyrophosphate-dependent enzyme [Microbacteriaceae bacterium]